MYSRGTKRGSIGWIQVKILLFFSFLCFFFGIPSPLLSSSFYSKINKVVFCYVKFLTSHSFLLPVVLLLARFRRILVSSTPSPAILWSWKWTFGGVFTVQASYSAFIVAALGEESLKCKCDCYIGLYIFLYVFLRKVGEKGGSWLSKWLLLN